MPQKIILKPRALIVAGQAAVAVGRGHFPKGQHRRRGFAASSMSFARRFVAARPPALGMSAKRLASTASDDDKKHREAGSPMAATADAGHERP